MLCVVKTSKTIIFFFSSKEGVTKITNKRKIWNFFKENVKLNFIKTNKLHELLIFIISLRIFSYDLILNKKPDLIICRNIYGAIFYSFFSKKKLHMKHIL